MEQPEDRSVALTEGKPPESHSRPAKVRATLLCLNIGGLARERHRAAEHLVRPKGQSKGVRPRRLLSTPLVKGSRVASVSVEAAGRPTAHPASPGSVEPRRGAGRSRKEAAHVQVPRAELGRCATGKAVEWHRRLWKHFGGSWPQHPRQWLGALPPGAEALGAPVRSRRQVQEPN